MSDPLVQREVRAIEIKNGKAYLPFNVDDLYWLFDHIPRRDPYREVVRELIKKMEDEAEIELKQR